MVFFNECLVDHCLPQLFVSAFLRQLPFERISDPHLVRSALPILLMGIIKFTPYPPILVNNNSVFLPILVFLIEVNVITTKMYIDMEIWPH